MLNCYMIFHIILLIEEAAYCSQLNSLSEHYIPSILFHLLLPQFTGTTAIWQLSLALPQTSWKTQHQTTSSLLSIKACYSITAFWVVDYFLVSSLTPLLHDIAQHYFSNDTFLRQGPNTYSFLILRCFYLCINFSIFITYLTHSGYLYSNEVLACNSLVYTYFLYRCSTIPNLPFLVHSATVKF